jgi:predicted secreted hydrolase
MSVSSKGDTQVPPYKNCPMSANQYKLGGAGLCARRHFCQVGRRAHPASFVGKLALGLILVLLVAGAGWAGETFELPRPGRVWSFPRDHGAHPEFKTEWWYYVGHLKAASGESFGYQLTFFRVALRKPDPQARSAWSLHTVYFAHLALTDAARRTFFFREQAGRGALGLSGATAGAMKVWIDDWRAELKAEEFHLQAQDRGLGLDLALKPLKPPVLHGQDGYSRKSGTSGAASYYYSLSRLDTRGTILVDGRRLPVTGESWMDHEFFSSAMAPNLAGWDWFSLQLDGGWEVMLYLLRQKDGSMDPASAGSLIDPAGGVRHLNLADFEVRLTGSWTSPHTRTNYPGGWEITIPGAGYRLRLTPAVADQEIRSQAPAKITYWEGQVKIEGDQNGVLVNGLGYAELTGYAGGLGGRF